MSKPPTIHDVARAIGVHKSTVSLALSGKGSMSSGLRARVVAAAREMGYEPNPLAQRLARGHQNSLVCLFSGALDVGLATAKALLIQKALNAAALEAPIYSCSDSTHDRGEAQVAQVRQICRQRPRAVVCAAQMIEPPVFAELDAYRREGGIVVSYDVPAPITCDQVVFDREESAWRAARYLLERGHRRLGLVMSHPNPAAPDVRPGTPHGLRIAGFRRALAEVGAPERGDWLLHVGTYEQGGAEMARRFLALTDRPTALCIVNDYVALAFMVEVMRAGLRIPGDVSVIGQDDQPVAAYCPVPLTAVSQPIGEIAAAVADTLRARLEEAEDTVDDGAGPRTIVIRGRLVERESVGPPAGG